MALRGPSGRIKSGPKSRSRVRRVCSGNKAVMLSGENEADSYLIQHLGNAVTYARSHRYRDPDDDEEFRVKSADR